MKYSLLSILVGSLLLAGCGGGDNKTSNQSKGIETPEKLTTSKVDLANQIPITTKSLINEIVTPLGSTVIGGNIPTVNTPSVAMALNKDGQIVMLGFAKSNMPTMLDENSTALGLVYLLLHHPKDVSDEQLETYIKESAGFPELLNSVKQAFNAGQIVSNDMTILKQSLNVANQVYDRLDTVPKTAMARALPIDPAVESPYPFSLIKNEKALGSITINESKRLVNSIPLAWDATAKDYQGNILPNGKIKIPMASLGNRIATGVSDWGIIGLATDYFGSQDVIIPDDNGKTFSLTVEQTNETRITNMSSALADLIAIELKVLAETDGEKCAAEVTKAVMTGLNIEQLAKGGASGFIDSLKIDKVQLSNAMKAYKISASCAPSLGKNIEKIATAIAPKLFYVYQAYKALENTYKYASVAERLYIINKEWETKETYTVCMGQNGKISNCAVKFKLQPEGAIVATAGAEIPIILKAYDKNDKETLLPNSLKFQTDDIQKLSINADNTKLTALKQGVVQLRALDPTTDKKNDFPIEIVYPRFKESEITIKEGETVTLPLTDQKGRTIQYNGLTEWSSGDEAVANVSTFMFDPKKYAGTQIVIKGLKVGETNITGKNLTDGSLIGVRVKVEKEQPIVPKFTGQVIPENRWSGAAAFQIKIKYQCEENCEAIKYIRNIWAETHCDYIINTPDQPSASGSGEWTFFSKIDQEKGYLTLPSPIGTLGLSSEGSMSISCYAIRAGFQTNYDNQIYNWNVASGSGSGVYDPSAGL
ncbi:hypothetical protein [Acinetobacter modestus]|uniref:Ig-like domain-containing protein n=1 Tax=Acinetobacter modestus TaxID=1776740 RepID=A0ABP2TVW8_9GAMM|nr:hypothetical protein [Acinetobacter modestus]ENU26284.1 hypothetical protein F992_02621 [Acinetobacter modestus]GGA13375.1 hypothetical protein GCM10017554_06840 [Acinetobacter modestus]